jgi:hypothetical protein
MNRGRLLPPFALTLTLAALMLPASADAYRLHPDRYYTGPVVTFFNGTGRFAKELYRYRSFINKNNMNFELRPAADRAKADIRIGLSSRFSCRRRAVPFGSGGNGRVTMGRDCKSNQKTMLAFSHEMSHALGLMHESRRCAVMNPRVTGTGAYSRPYMCAWARRNWYAKPLLLDDIRGLRAEWKNNAPRADMQVKLRSEMPPQSGIVSDPETDARYRCALDVTTDGDWNLRVQTIDWGDGTIKTHYPYRYVIVRNWPLCHGYEEPGLYTITMTATDTYGARSSKAVQVSVEFDTGPIWVDD